MTSCFVNLVQIQHRGVMDSVVGRAAPCEIKKKEMRLKPELLHQISRDAFRTRRRVTPRACFTDRFIPALWKSICHLMANRTNTVNKVLTGPRASSPTANSIRRREKRERRLFSRPIYETRSRCWCFKSFPDYSFPACRSANLAVRRRRELAAPVLLRLRPSFHLVRNHNSWAEWPSTHWTPEKW